MTVLVVPTSDGSYHITLARDTFKVSVVLSEDEVVALATAIQRAAVA